MTAERLYVRVCYNGLCVGETENCILDAVYSEDLSLKTGGERYTIKYKYWPYMSSFVDTIMNLTDRVLRTRLDWRFDSQVRFLPQVTLKFYNF